MVGKAYVKKLWKKALVGDGAAFRRLGILFLKGEVCRRDKKAARLCLQKAMEAGDERGYLLYHRLFSRGKEVIDDVSYIQMYQEYRLLPQYLALGTRRQKRLVFNQPTG